MTRPVGERRDWFGVVLALAVLIGAGRPVAVAAQARPDDRATCQVTLFAINAMPGSTLIDPKLSAIAPQLRKLLPGHGFTLLDVRSKALHAGQAIRCDLGNGLTASTVLVRPLDENGKVELRLALLLNEISQFDIPVATPPNQLFFCDRLLDNGHRLLIGVGAR